MLRMACWVDMSGEIEKSAPIMRQNIVRQLQRLKGVEV